MMMMHYDDYITLQNSSFLLILAASNSVRARYFCRPAVCLSLCLSVWQTRRLWQNKVIVCLRINTVRCFSLLGSQISWSWYPSVESTNLTNNLQ